MCFTTSLVVWASPSSAWFTVQLTSSTLRLRWSPPPPSPPTPTTPSASGFSQHLLGCSAQLQAHFYHYCQALANLHLQLKLEELNSLDNLNVFPLTAYLFVGIGYPTGFGLLLVLGNFFSSFQLRYIDFDLLTKTTIYDFSLLKLKKM